MGAVAACIRRDSNCSDEVRVNNSLVKVEFPALDGQAFCFLPLPVRTQLPLHINAYFELSSNRRDIWRGDDTTGESKVRGQWNDLLLRDVLAPLYGMLLSRAVLYATQQNAKQQARSLPIGDAQLFSNDDHSNQVEEYLSALLNKRQECSVALGLLPSPPPPEPWSILSTALLPLLKNTEVCDLFYMKLLFNLVNTETHLIYTFCITCFRFYGVISMVVLIYLWERL